MGKCQDTYKEVRVFKYPRATIRVHFPDITEEENERRKKQVARAVSDLMREYYKVKGVS